MCCLAAAAGAGAAVERSGEESLDICVGMEAAAAVYAGGGAACSGGCRVRDVNWKLGDEKEAVKIIFTCEWRKFRSKRWIFQQQSNYIFF